MPTDVSLKKLILIPAVITLAVTLLRLAGELMHWSPLLFNPAPGGGGALVGIAWLVPVFGIYFAMKLTQAGERPSSAGAAIGYPLLGGLLLPALGFARRSSAYRSRASPCSASSSSAPSWAR